VSRLIARLAEDSEAALAAIIGARARARERVWNWAGAPVQDGRVVIDLDATLVTAHSDKEDATRTWKKTFGFHPLLAYVDHGTGGGGEPVAELLRPGKAGSNTAVDHVSVLDAALTQLPEPLPTRRAGPGRGAGAYRRRRGHPCLHLPPCRAGVEFSVGASLGHFDVHPALAKLPAAACSPAYQSTNPRAGQGRDPIIEPRDGAWVAEATDLVDLSSWPPGTRLILRKERPHPGAQLRTTDADGMRITGLLTNTASGGPGRQLADLELRHRRHARVEDRIRAGKDTGLANLPFHTMAQDRIWVAIAALAADLLGWCTHLALPAHTTTYEPKRLRLRILAVAGRIVRTARRRLLKIDPTWPWAEVTTTAHTRLIALPPP